MPFTSSSTPTWLLEFRDLELKIQGGQGAERKSVLFGRPAGWKKTKFLMFFGNFSLKSIMNGWLSLWKVWWPQKKAWVTQTILPTCWHMFCAPAVQFFNNGSFSEVTSIISRDDRHAHLLRITMLLVNLPSWVSSDVLGCVWFSNIATHPPTHPPTHTLW